MGRESDWDTPNNRDAMADLGGDSLHPPDDGSEYDTPGGETGDWLERARRCYSASTDFMQSNVRAQWDRNYRSFASKHQDGSKYHSDEYKHRSKLFRPKTRAAARNAEAGAATAFFSTDQVASVEPADDSDEIQLGGARLIGELLKMRLSRKPIRWFPTVMGAVQDARITGFCVSKQYWRYERIQTGNRIVEEYDRTDGLLVGSTEEPIYEVLADEPVCELRPPENVRFDPAASWLDPINTSPYFIDMIPMFVVDVEARMEMEDSKTGHPGWNHVARATLLSATSDSYNSTRQAREGNRQDAKDGTTYVGHDDYRVVWVHENFMRVNGIDWHYYSLGHEAVALLSEPVPVFESYPHLRWGERPYTMGYSVLESHKTYPASPIELTQDLQQETNEITNQRVDNVRQAMNPRVFTKPGSGLDLAALRRSAPMSAVSINGGPNRDNLLIDRPPDVTASSYREQTLLATEFDELAGNFSVGSVQDNRQIGETVGGMEMVRQASGSVSDYEIKCLTETWLEPTLDHLVRLIQHYETDSTILAVAAKKAQIFERYRINVINDELMQHDMTVTVNAGIGSTDPNMKMARFMAAAEAVVKLLGPMAMKRANAEEVTSEVFGILGFKDGGSRFFDFGDDPKFAIMEDMLQQLQGEVQSKKMEIQGRLAETRMDNETKIRLEEMSAQADLILQQLEGRQRMDEKRFEHIANMREDAYRPEPQPARQAQ